jgi:hypothetical protein
MTNCWSFVICRLSPLDKLLQRSRIEHMSDRIIRASEIATYVYCRRAWHLQRQMGYQSTHVRPLADGRAHHEAHGRQVGQAIWTQRAALIFLFLAAGVTFYLLLQTLAG